MTEIEVNDVEAAEILKITLEFVKSLVEELAVEYQGCYEFNRGQYRITISSSLIVHIYLREDSVRIMPTAACEPLAKEILTLVKKRYEVQEKNRKSFFLNNFGLPG